MAGRSDLLPHPSNALPQRVRGLLLEWTLSEDADERDRLWLAAMKAADAILSRTAPVGWAWALFPLCPDERSLSISYAADCMEALAQMGAAASGPFLGRAAHAAHVLKSRQLPEGCWQEWWDARTGEPIGDESCAMPVLTLFSRLDQLLQSTEFSGSARLAREWTLREG
ncbi:MAG TPA: hypothetical protein VFJ58_23665 [Armatimonadota bacterium]|nr:hypothetical protein [Armatimonadota bacterium]